MWSNQPVSTMRPTAQHSAITQHTHLTTRPTKQHYIAILYDMPQQQSSHFAHIAIRTPQTPRADHSKQGKMRHSMAKTVKMPSQTFMTFRTITNKPLTLYPVTHYPSQTLTRKEESAQLCEQSCSPYTVWATVKHIVISSCHSLQFPPSSKYCFGHDRMSPGDI